MVLCLGAATPLGTLFFYAPGYASFRVPARHLFVVSLCLAVGSGLAFADLTRRREGFGVIAAAVVVTALLAVCAFGVFAWRAPDVRALVADNSTYTNWALVWPLTLAAAIAACALAARALTNGSRSLLVVGVLLIVIQVTDLAMLHYRMPGQRFEYADIRRGEAILHPRMVALREELQRTGERVLATDGSQNQFLLPNLTRPWGVPAASGTGSLGIERYVDVLGMGGPGDVYPATLSAVHRGVDLFSIRYALVRQDSTLAEDLRRQTDRWSALEDLHYYEQDPDTHYTLFKNARTLPHAWCAPAVIRASPRESLAAIRYGQLPGGGEFDPTRAVLVEPDVLRGWHGGTTTGEPGEVVAQFDRPSRYLVRVNAPCLLVLSEVYYPWWRGSVDDVDVGVARVNHTMIGIPLQAGTHVVRLWLRPMSVWAGGAMTAVSLLLWAAVVMSAVSGCLVKAATARQH